MGDISTWSATDASNNQSPPNGWPEGMAPSDVNNSARADKGATRRWYNTPQWRDLGDTVTRVTDTTFIISGDVTANYVAGCKIRCADSSTLYGTIISAVFSSPNTTVTVELESGVLSAALSDVAIGHNVEVAAQNSLGMQRYASNAITTTYTVTVADFNKLVTCDASGGAFTVTLLAAATAGDGFRTTIKKTDSSANAVTIDGNGAETIDGAASVILESQYDSVDLVCDGSNWFIKASEQVGPELGLGYLSGLKTELDTDTDHDIKFNPGECRDATDSVNIKLSSAIVKRVDATWAAGTGNGGLASPLTVAADTTYHFFVIRSAAGVVDCGFDTSVTAVNLLADSGYTHYRRVGSLLTDSSANWLGFYQSGDNFFLNGPIRDKSSDSYPTTPTAYNVSIPSDIEAVGRFNIVAYTTTVGGSGNVIFGLISSALDTNNTASSTDHNIRFINGTSGGFAYSPNPEMNILTSGATPQIYAHFSSSPGSSSTFNIFTKGWVDNRGK